MSENGVDESYSAVVLYFRLGPSVSRVVESLLTQVPAPGEVILVDNASGDGVCERVARDHPAVRLVTLRNNTGYAGGMNSGVRALAGVPAWYLFVTHEVRLEPEAVGRMLRRASATAGPVAVVGPQLRLSPGDSVWSFGGVVTPRGEVQHLHAPRAGGDPDWIDGACILADARIFQECEGFDERYFLYWEDADYSIRAGKRGRVLVAEDAIAQQGTGMMPPYFAARNQVLMWRTHRRPFKMLYAVARFSLSGVFRRPRWGGVFADPQIRAARLAGVRDGMTGHLSTKHTSRD